MMGDFGKDSLQLQNELTEEEYGGPIRQLSELVAQREKREKMERRIVSIEQSAHLLRRRFGNLPALPDPALSKRAQSLLHYPNSRILIAGTVFPGPAASIMQVLVMDFTGCVRLQRCVAVGYRLSREELRMLGITAQDLQEAVSLPEVWPALLEEITGTYIVAYDLPHLCSTLEIAARHYDLEPAVLIGECLLQLCLRYYHASGLTGLASLCEYIGHPLPAFPTATERACGQLHLLHAIAEGNACMRPDGNARDEVSH